MSAPRPAVLPRLIGVSGWARSGKDSVAESLSGTHRRVAFADKMREAALALDPIIVSRFYPDLTYKYRRLSFLIDAFGWEGVKETTYGPDVRRLLQRLGTDAGRKVLGEDVWVEATLNSLDNHEPVIVTDMRFPNEARAIRRRGGVLVRVERPGNQPAQDDEGNVHTSETALDHWSFDVVFHNDGSLADLGLKARQGLAGL